MLLARGGLDPRNPGRRGARALFVFDVEFNQPPNPTPGSIGLAQVTKTLEPKPCSAAASPTQDIPLDVPVRSALGVSPTIHAQPTAGQSALQEVRPSPFKTYFRRSKCPLSANVVEATGAPPPDIGPARVDAASRPPPVMPSAATEANSKPTGVVEVDLASLPASPSRPAGVDAMNVPLLVAQDEFVLTPQESVVDAPTASKTSTFIAKISKPVQEVLQCPPPPKPRKRTLPEDFIQRRSRRVAKLPPISDHQVAESVCRQLCFKNGEDDMPKSVEAISEEALAQYAKIFEHTLSQEHVKALCSFDWVECSFRS